MSVVLRLHIVFPIYYNQYEGCPSFQERGSSKFSYPFVSGKISRDGAKCMSKNIRYRNPLVVNNDIAKRKVSRWNCILEESDYSMDWSDEEEDFEDIGTPWEGAIMYKRNPTITHVEYCTTLERLGLGKLSSDVSKSRASLMGLRVTKDVKDYPCGTPVQISIDVTRKKKKLKLDGIIKTVLALECTRCAQPAAECVFSEFSLLLCDEPIKEPDIIDLGVIFGEDALDTPGSISNSDDEDDEASVDLDDWLHFPPEDKEIDISKNIRDNVHLEITHDAICNPSCRGLCFKCGTNLNLTNCDCEKEEDKEKGYSPFRNLREQLQKM